MTARPVIPLDGDWQFAPRRQGRCWLGGGSDDQTERVQLPHCWNTRDTFEPGAVYRQGWGSYRTRLQIPASSVECCRMWRLRSEGFYGVGDVWLNGVRLARVDGQYLGFDLPVDAAALCAENEAVIGVRLDNRYHRHVLPGFRMPDFLLYGGLAGRMWLEGMPDIHWVESETWVDGSQASAQHAEAVIAFGLGRERGDVRDVSVRWTVREVPDGRVVAQTERLAVSWEVGAEHVAQSVRLAWPNPRLWSPSCPALYEATGDVFEGMGGRVLDAVRIRFGCRAAEFRPDAGFFLNGERLELRGCNRHESMPGFGNALPAAIHRADARLLKSMGANFVRLSHYPQHPAFLDACDELGLLVYAELASWKSVRTGGWLRAAGRQWDAMIRRDRHHPSVILWGMGNEARSCRAYQSLRSQASELDPGRAVTYAENHLYRARRARTLGIPDVWGCNYELDVLEEGRQASRLRNVVVSELANYPPAVRGDAAEELNQVALIGRELARLGRVPAVSGFALWCFTDYATLRKGRDARHCGLVDAWRLPKAATEWLRARSLDEPVLALRGDWSRNGTAPLRRIDVYTNCDRVTLTLEGREVAESRGLHGVCEVPYAAAPLTAVGTRNGREVTAQILPHGVATRLRLELDAYPGLEAGGEVLGLRVTARDDAGVVDATWKGCVVLSAEAPAIVRAHTPDDRVPLANGHGRAFIALPRAAGQTTIVAAVAGLGPARLRLTFAAAPSAMDQARGVTVLEADWQPAG